MALGRTQALITLDPQIVFAEVARDGKRMLVAKAIGEHENEALGLVEHWTELIKK
jgi:hypothetical protein